MATTVTANATVSATVVGNGYNGNPLVAISSGSNASAPPPTTWTLANSLSNSIVVPSTGYTVNVAILIPPTGSVNAKTLKGGGMDLGIAWTAQPVMIPVSAGATIYAGSAAAEIIEVIFA